MSSDAVGWWAGRVRSESGGKVEGPGDHFWDRGISVHLGSRMNGRRPCTLKTLKSLMGPECK